MNQWESLKKLGIESGLDLINHIPARYEDLSLISNTKDADIDQVVTIKGEIASLKNQRTRRGLLMQIGALKDEFGKIQIVWFNQPFLTKSFYPGKKVSLSGKVSFFGRSKALVSPEYELIKSVDDETRHTGNIIPIYPETSGISSKWIRTRIKKILEEEKVDLKEYLPKEVLTRYKLIGIRKAYKDIHFPKSLKSAMTAKKRFAFNELLDMSLKSELKKKDWMKQKTSKKLISFKKEVGEFIDNLPFKLTASQETALDQILNDMVKPNPMNRLLEGDVGSGKTVVAAVASFLSFLNGYQSVFMAPTQMLAAQHYETLRKLFKKFNLRISLLTSNVKKAGVGRSDIIVGTHSLIHGKLDLKEAALVVIDEQHRFGVEQRRHLVKRSRSPHVLTMTATPIPRTIAQVMFGDLDLTTMTDMPKGRQNITTYLVLKNKWNDAFKWMDKEMKKHKSQAFVICPLIEESQKESMKDIKAVATEFEKIKKEFKNFSVGLLHGRLPQRQKDEVLSKFRKGKTNILVSTPVVEVGIDIPNAAIMAILTPEKFGLAQLHQLRGRVGRGEKKSFCLLLAERETRRLTALTKIYSGFELAEIDLKLRGPGEVMGIKQHGFFRLKAADWTDTELISQTKELAKDAAAHPKDFPMLIKSRTLDKIRV